MKKLDPEKFLILHLIDGIHYQNISNDYGIERDILSSWWNENIEIRSVIKKANQLYNSKKSLASFTPFIKLGRVAFYEWYRDQDKKCHYCKTPETVLKELFEKELSTKRKRGKSLELERKNSTINEYSPENCVLACYFCNNHKSDILSEADHIEYFAKPIGQFLKDKHQKNKSNELL
jgi:5-methylcytosine-specific restriction endonuclease McrA